MTAEELGNQHGYRCPACKSGEDLKIQAVQRVEARLYPDGTDDDGGDIEWKSTSLAWCIDCNWAGQVRDLIVEEIKA